MLERFQRFIGKEYVFTSATGATAQGVVQKVELGGLYTLRLTKDAVNHKAGDIFRDYGRLTLLVSPQQ